MSFAWPDGSVVLDHASAALGSGRTGLIGANGAGKTMLLRLLAGELATTSGSISRSAAVGVLPQHLARLTETTLAELLGVRRTIDALRAIESGDTSERHFDAVGDDWDIEARTSAVLDEIGLGRLDLDRPIGGLSGGETVLAALAGLRIGGAGIVLLDEPTNNLDRESRARLSELILHWRGALIIVSHDTRLLEAMDATVELRDARLRVFDGGYSAFRRRIDSEQEAIARALSSAEQTLRTEERQRITAETTLARRARYARTDYENKRKPKVIMNARRSEAQVSAGKLRTETAEKIDAARRSVANHEGRLREDERIRIDLPDPDVPASRRLAEIGDGETTLLLQGPERAALLGRNGIGKTRPLEALVRGCQLPAPLRAIARTDRIGYLPQRRGGIDPALSFLDAVREVAPSVPPGTIRSRLARFLIRGDAVHRRVGALSGGERFRLHLARLLLADPPPRLLVLDEPTNDLDVTSVDQLVEALVVFRGGILVVSHDEEFLSRLGLDTAVELREGGRLVMVDPPQRPEIGWTAPT
ncbi:ATP-binding cassette domain-containing protein [Rathayibacter sp. VKM Ac-2760]|uniref:ATP-binding cassette domain-containing protein n=1 Tax=Rathayibacter sp. VKM Ac-2760 TaxID=2609253 RepID=UPI0032980A04